MNELLTVADILSNLSEKNCKSIGKEYSRSVPYLLSAPFSLVSVTEIAEQNKINRILRV